MQLLSDTHSNQTCVCLPHHVRCICCICVKMPEVTHNVGSKVTQRINRKETFPKCLTQHVWCDVTPSSLICSLESQSLLFVSSLHMDVFHRRTEQNVNILACHLQIQPHVCLQVLKLIKCTRLVWRSPVCCFSG